MLPPTFNKCVTVPDCVLLLNVPKLLTVIPLFTVKVTALVELGYIRKVAVLTAFTFTASTVGFVEFNPIVNEDIVGPVASVIVQVGADV